MKSTTSRSWILRHGSREAFTLLEMLLVVSMVGVMLALTLSPLNKARDRINARSARVAASQGLARARTTAVSRGCPSTFHVSRDAVGKMWVTSCTPGTIGAAAQTLDTVGRIDSIGTRFGVTVSGTADTVRYDARGLSAGFTSAAYAFVTSGGRRDTLTVSAIGRIQQ